MPEDWRLANVTPIFKKGSKQDKANYRPISLTSVVCKLMESVIRDKVTTFVEQNNLIRNSQHGFSRGKSCLTNLLSFFDKITDEVDKGNSIDVVYLDFAKAFDKVPHQRLLNKIKSLGVSGNVHRWIEGWLSNRKQRVVINGEESDWVNVTSGVPQGSVLGPLLFLIYINDIDKDVTGIISKFADDTKLGRVVKNNIDKNCMQQDLNVLSDWANKWQMKFNASKCKVIRFGNNKTQSEYMMDGQVLSYVEEEKDLGVIIHRSLKNSRQCQEAVKKANKVLGMIKRNITCRKKEVILPLYRSLVRPHLEYCVQFWSPSLVKDISLMEKVQRRATKIISGMHTLSYEERLEECNLFSLGRRRLRGDMIQMFKIWKGIDRLSFSDLGIEVNSGVTRGHQIKLVKQRARLNIRKGFFTHRVINFWNGLPDVVLETSTVGCFKLRLDAYMSGLNIL